MKTRFGTGFYLLMIAVFAVMCYLSFRLNLIVHRWIHALIGAK